MEKRVPFQDRGTIHKNGIICPIGTLFRKNGTILVPFGKGYCFEAKTRLRIVPSFQMGTVSGQKKVSKTAPPLANMIIKEKTAPPSKVAQFSKMAPG